MKSYKELPDQLAEYLAECHSDGATVTESSSEDGHFWIIDQDLGDWLTLVEWYEGNDDSQLINLCGPAYKKLKELMEVD